MIKKNNKDDKQIEEIMNDFYKTKVYTIKETVDDNQNYHIEYLREWLRGKPFKEFEIIPINDIHISP